jgi:hypothetical protein
LILEKVIKLDSLQPRFLRFRSHYKIYLILLSTLGFLNLSFWSYRFLQSPFREVLEEQSYELIISLSYFALFGAFYFFWLRYRLNNSVQVFESHIFVHKGKLAEQLNYEDVESVSIVAWSLFYLKMKNGHKHYFNSSLERVDYVWEGLKNARPDLVSLEDFENFRLKLIQYDHHQKRKEWFFKHKLVDVFSWFVLPCVFLFMAYSIQSQNVMISQPGLYFFRLFMYSVLILLVTTFSFSLLLKKFVFDRRIESQVGTDNEKIRDIEFEGVVLQRSKIFQMMMTSFFLGLVIRTDINLFSVTRVKDDLTNFSIKKGSTIVVDNRYNCTNCKYNVTEGDLVFFGKGTVGLVLAKEGEMVGQVSLDKKGRSIASENVHEVPVGHLAIRTANGKDVVFVRIKDLVGKIQK